MNGDVLNFGVLERNKLDNRTVKRSCLKFRRCAAFHVGDLRVFVGDDERALELAEVFRVDSEVGLQGLLEFYAFRHVDKAAAGEGGAVKRGEFVIRGWDDLTEVGLEDLGILGEAFA